jgi:cobalt-zinc-cadmium efflux system membrane fusion protein
MLILSRTTMHNRKYAVAPMAARRGMHFAHVLMLAAGFSFIAGCSSKTDDDVQPAQVTVSNVKLSAAQLQHIRLYTITSSNYDKTIEANGLVDFDNNQATSVLAPVSGPVAKLMVDIGAKVKKGDPLAIVDSPDFATAVSTYRKAVSSAQTLRKLADLDKDLLQHHGVAQREADQAQSDAVSAEADEDAALKGLSSLSVDPHVIAEIKAGRPIAHIQGIIRSPISGTVVEKLITPGELLQAGTTPCFTVADLSRVWVLAQVPDDDLASVSVGDKADVETGTGSPDLVGKVDNVAALVNADTRLVSARVVVENPAGLLKKQMYVTVHIQSQKISHGILVPVSAMLRDDENLPFVYVVESDNSFARRSITLGSRVGDQYDVPTGLNAGDRIVVDGGIFVQFMQNQ